MEGTKTRTRRLLSLAVLQEFAGGRLERQVWSRAYELAAPVMPVVADRIRRASSAEVLCRTNAMVQPTSKGA